MAIVTDRLGAVNTHPLTLQTVEWDMLLFFAAMFVMIEASVSVGMIGMIGGWLESAIRATPESSRTIVAIQILLWVSAVVSGILDNIPYTITMGECVSPVLSSSLLRSPPHSVCP